jgi:hypothetical protein
MRTRKRSPAVKESPTRGKSARIRTMHAKLVRDMRRVVELSRMTAWLADDLAELVVQQVREEAFPLMLLPDGTDHELLRSLVVAHAICFSVANQVEIEIPSLPNQSACRRKRKDTV